MRVGKLRPLRTAMSQRDTFRTRRRGARVNSCVPVSLEWEVDPGKTVQQEAQTRVVGPYGCLVVFPHNLELEQRVRLTNLATHQTNTAVVVWKGSERAEGWELGIALIDPVMNFWGLEL